MIQVDIWGGKLHQRLAESRTFEEWPDALGYIQKHVDAGNLANVLATDFKAPKKETDAAFLALIKGES